MSFGGEFFKMASSWSGGHCETLKPLGIFRARCFYHATLLFAILSILGAPEYYDWILFRWLGDICKSVEARFDVDYSCSFIEALLSL